MNRINFLGGIAVAASLCSVCAVSPALVPPVPVHPIPKHDVRGYPAPTIAPVLSPRKREDDGLPPIAVDDPFNEEDPGRTAANRLTPEQIRAMLDNEESLFWQDALRRVYNDPSLSERRIAPPRTSGANVWGRSQERYRASKKLVALTFDDGPHTATTPAILDILERNHVRATFFFVGVMAERHPELVLATVREGHSVGNHTFHHVTMVKLSAADALTEIAACGNSIKAAVGATPHLFRPPGGQYNAQIAEGASVLGYQTILWTCDPGDYLRLSPEIIAQRTLKTITPGGIIILHSGVPETVRALPYLIQSLRGAGYQFVTVDEMLQRRKSTPK